jgi:molecular chaperone GrpE
MNETDLLREPEADGSPAEHGTEHPHRMEDAERMREVLVEAQDRNSRLLAEFDTFRRRATGERELAERGGKRSVLLTLLPVLDTLERALAAGSTDAHFYEGVAATFRLFMNALLEAGAEPFDSVGHTFNPTLHEAIEMVHAENAEPGTITRQVLRGWRLAGELLRPARVIVADDRRESPTDV